jgi:hypothetical protein
MILQTIISQSNTLENNIPQPPVSWEAATSGNYPDLTGLNQTKVTLFAPTTINVNCYNHHPHCIEFDGAIHVIYSTANKDEEEAGQYARYQKSTDGGATWSSPVVFLESQDDITKGWAVAGRVCIPSGFSITGGKLYGIIDINDKGASNTSRIGVGIIAIEIKISTLGNPFWIENVNGTLTAPAAISGYPIYLFDSILRAEIRAFLYVPKNMPTWYFSVLSSDRLYTRDTFGANAVSEPSSLILPNNQIFRLWRLLTGGSATKIAQTSLDGITWFDTYDTGIPDFPSKTKLNNIRNGKIGITGNADNVIRTPLFFGISNDGLTYKANNVYNMDTQTVAAVFSGIYKDTGVQYPDTIQLNNNKIFCVYSVNKEDIKISVFDSPITL